MDPKTLHRVIERQVMEATQQYGLSIEKLKFSTHLFKPDSPKLETFVAVDIGWSDNKTYYISTLRYFYSPAKYQASSAPKLKTTIETYLKRKNLKRFEKTPPHEADQQAAGD